MPETINSPLTLPCGVQLPNRLVKAAMTEGLANPQNEATEQHQTLYRKWAEGGIGLQITGNVQVNRRNLERPGNVVIDAKPSNTQMDMLSRWAEAGKSGGGAIVMQVSHAGRQTPKNVNPTPQAPSGITVSLPGGQFGKPRAMTKEEIAETIEGFGIVAGAARQAGFDGVQIHAAHGYLLSQFLSPLVNQREDEWGGPLDNRARLLLAAVNEARVQGGPGFAVTVKLNSTDFQKGGFSHEDCLAVIDMLNDAGVDFVEISGGNYEQPKMMDMEGMEPVFEEKVRESTRAREAYFANYARSVQTRATMPLMVTGGFRSVAAMNAALEDGEADLIGLARPLCVDTQLPDKLLTGALDEAEKWEKKLRIGPGFLGPNSSSKTIKSMNGFGAQGWFCHQIKRLANDEAPNTRLGVFSALMKYQREEGAAAKEYLKTIGPKS